MEKLSREKIFEIIKLVTTFIVGVASAVLFDSCSVFMSVNKHNAHSNQSIEACRSLISLRFLIYGGRVTLISTLNVEDLLIDLHTKLLTFIEYTTTPEERSQRLKLLSDLRKK